MASFAYTNAAKTILAGTTILSSQDIRCLLVRDGTTADTERDVLTIDDFTTLDEVSGTGYSRKTLASKAVTADNANDLAKFTFDAIEWTGLDAGEIAAAILYRHVTDDTDSIPLFYLDGRFYVTAAAPASGGATTIYVDPLPGALASGATLAFPGVTATLTAPATRGARSLSVSALSGAISINTTAESPANGFPSTPAGINFSLRATDGLAILRNIRNN